MGDIKGGPGREETSPGHGGGQRRKEETQQRRGRLRPGRGQQRREGHTPRSELQQKGISSQRPELPASETTVVECQAGSSSREL